MVEYKKTIVSNARDFVVIITQKKNHISIWGTNNKMLQQKKISENVKINYQEDYN